MQNKRYITVVVAFIMGCLMSVNAMAKKGEDFKEFIAIEASAKFGATRIVENSSEAEVIEGLKKSLEIDGYEIEVYKPELGVISGVRNKRTKGPKNQLIQGLKLDLFGSMAVDEPEKENYVSYVVRDMGGSNGNVLIQARKLMIHWGRKGDIVNVGVDNDAPNYDGIYYLLSTFIKKPVRAVR